MARMAGYIRKSDREKNDEMPLETQRQQILEWCLRNGHELVGFYEDPDCRNKVPIHERSEEGGRRLLRDAARAKFDAVVVYRLDRWSRLRKISYDGFERLAHYDIGFYSTAETFCLKTGQGRLNVAILLAFAEFERDTTEERSRHGREQRVKEGRYVGGLTPYGYHCAGKRIEPDRTPIPGLGIGEADVVVLIFRWYVEEQLGGNRIAARLNSMGIPTPTQSGATADKHRHNWPEGRGFWQPETVRSILKNGTYHGTHNYGKTMLNNAGKRVRSQPEQIISQTVEPLITRAMFDAAQSRLRTHNLANPRNTMHSYLLRGKIKCGVCGMTYIGRAIKSGDKLHYYYVCSARHAPLRVLGPGAAPCAGPYVRRDRIEADLWAHLEARLRAPGETLELLREQWEQQDRQAGSLIEVRDGLRRALDQKQATRRRTVDLLTEGVLSKEDGREKLTRLGDEEQAIQAQLGKLDAEGESVSHRREQLQAADTFMRHWAAQIDAPFSEADKRRCIEVFVDRIVVRAQEGGAVAHYRLCFEPPCAAGACMASHTRAKWILEATGQQRLAA